MLAAGASGVQVLTEYQSVYYLDPENQTGNASNSNSGFDSSAPLLTFAAAAAKQLDRPITVKVLGTVKPLAGAGAITNQGTPIARNIARTAWATFEPWPGEDRWGLARNTSLTSTQQAPILTNTHFLEMNAVDLSGARFTCSFPTGETWCTNLRLNDWHLTGDPTTEVLGTLSFRSTTDFEVNDLDLEGGDWPLTGGVVLIVLLGASAAPIQNASLNGRLHDYVDGDGIKLNYWDNVTLDFDVENSNRLTGALHMDAIQLENGGDGLDITLRIPSGTTFGAHCRATDVQSGSTSTNFRLLNCVTGTLKDAAHAYPLPHMPGMRVQGGDIHGLYIEGDDLTGGAPGLTIDGARVRYYSNTSGKQIVGLINGAVVDTVGPGLALP